MTKARELYERYAAGGATYVEQIIADKTAETLHLDFKAVDDRIADSDLGYYARALSGFANAEGGVLVWGVDCRSTGNEEPDVTQKAVHIEGLSKFIRGLESKTDEYLQPGINGVIHTPLPLAEGGDRGFAVTYIPRGEGPPQMSVARKNRGFYCRMGSTTKPMEHYQIADRFRERPQPVLEVFLKAGNSEPLTDIVHSQSIDVCVRNVGAGIATSVAISLNTALQLRYHSNVERKLNILPLNSLVNWITLALPLTEPIYPNSFTRLAYFTWTFPLEPKSRPLFAPLHMEFRTFCDGAFSSGLLEYPADKPISGIVG